MCRDSRVAAVIESLAGFMAPSWPRAKERKRVSHTHCTGKGKEAAELPRPLICQINQRGEGVGENEK